MHDPGMDGQPCCNGVSMYDIDIVGLILPVSCWCC